MLDALHNILQNMFRGLFKIFLEHTLLLENRCQNMGEPLVINVLLITCFIDYQIVVVQKFEDLNYITCNY